MVTRVNFPSLPVVPIEAGDTVAAYRSGQIVRVPVVAPEGGTVTSVGVSMPAGFSVANSPVTSSGTITVTFDAGYALPTTAAMGQWSTAYGWGDHASAGYALASAVTSALAGKVDKVAGKGLSTEDYSTAEKNKLAGIETGAQVNTVTSVAGKTGAVTLAKGDVGLGNVDNTSDADKPISTAVSVALSGKVDTSDARLTDAREWTAATVGQAEAEAGTSTTRRAWTAQRVFQAIAAWWAASSAKSKLDGIATGATANDTDANLKNRANHTGTQPASTITGLATVATTGSYNDLTGKPSIPAGTVTSVGLSAPTGFSVSGSPVTGSGTLALTFASGYSLPTTAKQGQWDTAYGWGNHASAGYALSSSLATVATSGSYNDLSDKPTLGTAAAANTGDFATAAQGAKADTALQPAAIGVTVQGYSAALSGTTASFTTALKNKLDGIAAGATANTGTVTSVQVAMPTGLQASGGPVTSSGTITISYASGYAIPTTAKQGQWDTAYGWGNHAAAGYALASSLGTAAVKDAPASGNATAAQVVLGNDTRLTNARTPTAHGHTAAEVSGLATVATSGSYNDLSNKPSIPAGTVTSVGVSAPTGLSVASSPVTGSGTIAISYAAGYAIPTTAKQGQWDTAYGWGNHASAGYALSSNLAAVATTGSYNDLANKPSIPTLPATVGQAEAEAGTATTNRLWTAQRVRQSTVAYAYSKTEVDSLISAATSGAWVWQATTTALPKNTPSKVDFSSPRTLTLPASPAENDYVAILKTAGDTTGSVVARNGQTIMGIAENMTIDSNINYLRLDFVNSSWRIAS